MNAIKKTRRLIETQPASQAAQTLARLVRALESDENFHLNDLYQLDYNAFVCEVQPVLIRRCSVSTSRRARA